MGVVLDETPHPKKPVERSRGFVAVADPELGEAEGELAVTSEALVEDLDVGRAVHGLDRKLPILRTGYEHLGRELLGVSRAFPEAPVEEHRGVHLRVAVFGKTFTHVVLDPAVEHPAALVPEDHPRRLLLEMEEVHEPAEAAVVALFGLGETGEVSLEVFLTRPSRPVDARQHRPAVVASPVGAGELGQAKDLETPRVGHMRTAAEIDEITLAVDADDGVLRKLAENLELVGLAPLAHEALGLSPRELLAAHGKRGPGDRTHTLFDFRKILIAQRRRRLDVVVEPVLDGRTDSETRPGVEFLQGLRQKMRRGVAEDFEPFRIPRTHGRDFVLRHHGGREVADRPIDTSGQDFRRTRGLGGRESLTGASEPGFFGRNFLGRMGAGHAHILGSGWGRP